MGTTENDRSAAMGACLHRLGARWLRSARFHRSEEVLGRPFWSGIRHPSSAKRMRVLLPLTKRAYFSDIGEDPGRVILCASPASRTADGCLLPAALRGRRSAVPGFTQLPPRETWPCPPWSLATRTGRRRAGGWGRPLFYYFLSSLLLLHFLALSRRQERGHTAHSRPPTAAEAGTGGWARRSPVPSHEAKGGEEKRDVSAKLPERPTDPPVALQARDGPSVSNARVAETDRTRSQ